MNSNLVSGSTLVLCGITLFSPEALSENIRKKPNIILILADDMGYGDVSALNPQSKINTANIDLLARQGVVFTDAHSSSSVSTPSRYSLLTGRYNWRSKMKSGVLNGFSKPILEEGRTTLASMLKTQNYHTACVGKWHLGWIWDNIEAGSKKVDYSNPIKQGPTSVGFDYYYGISASLDFPPYVYVENDRVTLPPNRIMPLVPTNMDYMREGPIAENFIPMQVLPHIVDKAIQYIDEQAGKENPFFLYLPLPAPHTPILPTPEFQGKSGLNAYGDFVLMVDAMVGRIVKAVAENGMDENTIVIISSDNGCSPSAEYDTLLPKGHNPSYLFRGYKADLFDGGHRVPLIVKWNKVKPHTVDQTVCYTDFMATFAALTGYKLRDNEGEDSYNLLPLIEKKRYNKPVREATVHHSINGSFSIRQGDWKLLCSPSSAGWSYPRPNRDDSIIGTLPKVQLFNLKNDVGETSNCHLQYPELVEKLRSLLKKYISDGRSTPGEAQKNDGEPFWNQLKEL